MLLARPQSSPVTFNGAIIKNNFLKHSLVWINPSFTPITGTWHMSSQQLTRPRPRLALIQQVAFKTSGEKSAFSVKAADVLVFSLEGGGPQLHIEYKLSQCDLLPSKSQLSHFVSAANYFWQFHGLVLSAFPLPRLICALGSVSTVRSGKHLALSVSSYRPACLC